MSTAEAHETGGKADARRAQILDAAEACFVEHGFHRASISRICAKAGMSPGHVYHYFENKEAIIAAIVRRDLDRILDLTAGMRASDDVFEAMMQRVPIGVAEVLDPHTARLKLEIAAEASRNPQIARIVREADACSRASLRQTIQAARRARGLADDEAVAGELADAIAAMFDGLVIRSARNPDTDRATLGRRYQQTLQHLLTA